MARLMISSVFIMSGVSKIFNFAGTKQYMIAYGMKMFTSFFLVAAIFLELAGSLSLLLGYKTKWGSIALLIFLLPATIIFHTDFSQQLQVIMFTKNLTTIGGILLLLYYGPGTLSLDNKKSNSVP